ncbi:MAG: hypothetical protein QM723_09165 [Myxococcaceae bacterium]
MIQVTHAFMLLAAAPGVLLAMLSFRRQMANPLNTLAAWFLGAWLGGKGEQLWWARAEWRLALRDILHHPLAPLGLWGVAIGSSILTALYFAISRPPKSS